MFYAGSRDFLERDGKTDYAPSLDRDKALRFPFDLFFLLNPARGGSFCPFFPGEFMFPLKISRVIRAVLCGVWLCLASASSFAAPPTVEVLSADLEMSNPQEMTFERSRVVPHRTGQRYGWVIELRTTQRSVSVSEEYLLPSQLEAASKGDSVLIPLERRNQVSQRHLVPVDGQIFGEWEIGPGEPPGQRHLQVLIEGRVAASFEYEVRELPGGR